MSAYIFFLVCLKPSSERELTFCFLEIPTSEDQKHFKGPKLCKTQKRNNLRAKQPFVMSQWALRGAQSHTRPGIFAPTYETAVFSSHSLSKHRG